jgi:hypothetical protein
VLAVLGFAGYKFASGVGQTQHAAAATSQHPAHGGQPTLAPSITPTAQASTAQPTTPQPSLTTTPSGSPVAVQALTPASVAAFGPGGGDDPRQAGSAVRGNPATPWRTDWYTTPYFGDLYPGTGLLLDMGRTVTISSVRLALGSARGAVVQVRVGGRPVLADLHTVATSAGPGGTVDLSLASPTHARYLLIWFTKLPPDNAGTYQASVYGIAVRGQP